MATMPSGEFLTHHFIHMLMGEPTTISFLVGYTLFLTLSIAIAAVTFIAIESPFLRIRDKWLNVR